jgi:hypothetical protein
MGDKVFKGPAATAFRVEKSLFCLEKGDRRFLQKVFAYIPKCVSSYMVAQKFLSHHYMKLLYQIGICFLKIGVHLM